jgi:8-oxo-dGTP pyrophosphatase MutT (NUDIX family)
LIDSLQAKAPLGRSQLALFLAQGGWEDDEDVYQAACREAMEEAGVKGVVNVRHQCLLLLPIHLC